MACRERLQKISKALIAPLLVIALAGCKGELSKREELFERACGACHSTEKPLAKKKTREGWGKTVRVMKARGARISDAEAKIIAEYLYEIRPLEK